MSEGYEFDICKDGSVNGGIPRNQVLEVLRNSKWVENAVRIGRCFVCRDSDIDETGLCFICRAYLSSEEREAADKYYVQPHNVPFE